MYGFYVLQAIIILVSALIPIINLLGFEKNDNNDEIIRILSSVFGSLIVIVTGLLQLFKVSEKWILFMSTVDSLE